MYPTDRDSTGRPYHGVSRLALTAGLLATGTVLAGSGIAPATAQEATKAAGQAAVTLPAVAVEGQAASEGYKADTASLGRFTAPLLETPRSVTVVTPEVMQDIGATSLQDALRVVPGITMGMGEGGVPLADLPNIRGINSSSGLFVDGMRDNGSANREVFDLEEIDVIKGPSGSYIGRGAAGGAINLVTKTPQGRTFHGGTAVLGTDSKERLTADLNQVLNDSIAIRLNAMWQDADVPGRESVYDDRWGFAPSITFGMHSDTRATFSYYHYQSDGIADYGHPYDPATGAPVKVDRDNFYGLTDRDFQKQQTDTGTLWLEHDITDRLLLRNTTRYSVSSNDYIGSNPDDSQGNVVNGLVFRSPKSRKSENTTIANLTDLSGTYDTGPLKHSFDVGAEVMQEETTSRSYAVSTLAAGGVAIPRGGCNLFGAGPASGYNCTSLTDPNPSDPWSGTISQNPSTVTTTNTWSLFAYDTIDLSSQWSVNLGIRLDDYRTKTDTGLENKSTLLNYQGGVIYKPLPYGSVYVSYGTSSSPPGVTAGEGQGNISTGNENLAPEKYRNYEIGTKWDLFRNMLSVNAALFRTVTDNAYVATAPGRGAPQENLGKDQVDGLELGIAGNISQAWKVFGGYSYLRSEILEAGPVNPGTEGNELPNTPRHAFSLFSTYDVLPQFTLGGGAYYVAKVYGNTANDRYVPSYWRFDAMAQYRVTQNVSLQLNVNNILDETYYDKAYTTHMASVGAGRSAMLTAAVKF